MSKLKDPNDLVQQTDNLDLDELEFDDELNDETFGDPINDVNDDWETAQDLYNDKMEACISEMQKVVADKIPEIDLKIAATKYNYNPELALNSLLTQEQLNQLKSLNNAQLPNKSTIEMNGLMNNHHNFNQIQLPSQFNEMDSKDDDLIKNTLDKVANHFNEMQYHQLIQQQQQQLRNQAQQQMLLMNQQQAQFQASDLQSSNFTQFPTPQFIPPHLQQFIHQPNSNVNNHSLGNLSLSDSFATMNLNQQQNGFDFNNLNLNNLNALPINLRNDFLVKSNLERQLNQFSGNNFMNGISNIESTGKRALTLEEIEQGMLEEKKVNNETKRLTLEDIEESFLTDLQQISTNDQNDSFDLNINNMNEFPSLDSNQFPKITKTIPNQDKVEKQPQQQQYQQQSNNNRFNFRNQNYNPNFYQHNNNNNFNQHNNSNNFNPHHNSNNFNPHHNSNNFNPNNNHQYNNEQNRNQNFRNYHPSLIPNPLNPIEMITNTNIKNGNAFVNKQNLQKNNYNNHHRNYMKNNYYHPFNPASTDDEYAGLMTPKDISRIRRIQHMQLEFDDPYVQDYYFVNYQTRKIAAELKKRDKINGELHSAPQLVIPERNRLVFNESTETTRYIPPDFAGSLGKIRVANVNEPRKLLDLNDKSDKFTSKSDCVSIEPHCRTELNKFRRLLLEIERNLTNVLKVDLEDKKIAALPLDAQIPHLAERKRLCNELFNGILTTEDNMNVNFNIAKIRKGCMLIFKALQVLEEPEQKTVIISDLLKIENFQYVVMQKDKTLYCLDYGQVLIDAIKTIKNCDFECLLKIADGLDDASVVAKFQCGQEIIEVLLNQYNCFDIKDKNQKLRWIKFLNRVLEDVDDIPHLRELCKSSINMVTF